MNGTSSRRSSMWWRSGGVCSERGKQPGEVAGVVRKLVAAGRHHPRPADVGRFAMWLEHVIQLPQGLVGQLVDMGQDDRVSAAVKLLRDLVHPPRGVACISHLKPVEHP